MPRNGSGTMTRVHDWTQDEANGIDASSSRFDADTDDIANEITNSIAKDGQTTPTANLPMGTYRHTGVGNAVARTDYVAAGQHQDGGLLRATAVAGTNTITATLSPAITAYASGQTFSFVAANTNTGAVTLNLNGVGAKAITTNGTTALVGGEIVANAVVTVRYDGTQFQMETLNINALTAETAIAPDDQLPVYDTSEGGVNKMAAGLLVRVLAAGGNLTVPNDTTEDTLATVTVPANALGASGMLRITAHWNVNNNANLKTPRIRYSGAAGTDLVGATMTTATDKTDYITIRNNGATNAQSRSRWSVDSAATVTGGASATYLTVDTTASSTIVFTGQKDTAGDTLILKHYVVEILYSA